MFHFVQEELQRLLNDQVAKIQKVAILGLKNAGKTTIMKNVLYQFQSLFALAPGESHTHKNFEFLGRELLVRDIGGESRYKSNFFSNPPRYSNQIRYLYFVIDVQDELLIRQNIAYFFKLLEFCKHNCPYAKIYLFFHKFDDYNSHQSQFAQHELHFLQQVLPELQSYQSQLTIFHSTLKNPLTIDAAFLQPLLSNEDIYDTLCYTIRQFCVEHQVDFGILLVDDFELGHFYPDFGAIKDVYDTLFRIFEDVKHKVNLSKKKKERWLANLFQKNHIFTENFQITVKDVEFSFYFSIILNKNGKFHTIEEKIKEFTQDLKKILRHAEIIRDGELHLERIQKNIS